MDGRMDGRKFSPVFYRTSSPLGPLPCFPLYNFQKWWAGHGYRWPYDILGLLVTCYDDQRRVGSNFLLLCIVITINYLFNYNQVAGLSRGKSLSMVREIRLCSCLLSGAPLSSALKSTIKGKQKRKNESKAKLKENVNPIKKPEKSASVAIE